jgi:DNA-binding NarL/FixJ family response regulator
MAITMAEKQTVKIMIVDDHPVVREALTARIASQPDFEICGEADGVAQALRLLNDRKPDVIIIDISLSDGDGIDLIKRIKARGEPARMLVWSMHSEAQYAERALNAGAVGYLTKEQASDRIIEAIRVVLAGKMFMSPALSERLLRRSVGRGGAKLSDSPVEALSDRELEVFRLIGQGTKPQEIADRLHLSVKTVETHRDRIRKKLDLRDANELVCYAVKWVLENR